MRFVRDSAGRRKGRAIFILYFFSGICKKKKKSIFFLLIVYMIYPSSLHVVLKMIVMAEL